MNHNSKTTTAASAAAIENSAFHKGDRVVKNSNGKQYEVTFEPFIDKFERTGVDYRGQLVTYVQPINAKTGKAWQALQLTLVSELSPMPAEGGAQ